MVFGFQYTELTQLSLDFPKYLTVWDVKVNFI